MKRRFGSGRGQRGYVTVYSALVITFVLVPMLFFALDVASLMYYKAKAQNLADAAALAAVKDTQNWHIPIPTKFYGWIPYDGWFFNALTLKNVEALSLYKVADKDLKAAPRETLLTLNQDRSWGKENPLTLGKIEAFPGNFPSPIIGVRAPVTANVKVYTPFLGRALASGQPNQGGAETVTVTAEACAMAWYRPDRIVHGWWTDETLDALFDIPGTEPLKYYRAINCPRTVWNVAQLVEPPLTEWFFTRYGKDEGQRKLDEWWREHGDVITRRMKDEKEQNQGDPCSDDCGGTKVGSGTDKTWDKCHQSWSTCPSDLENEAQKKREEDDKRRAEEEARKAP